MAGLVSKLQSRLNSDESSTIPSFSIYGDRSNLKVFDKTVAFHIGQLGPESKEIDLIKCLGKAGFLDNLELCQRVGAQVHLTMKTEESKKTLLKKGLKYNNSLIIFRDPAVRVHCVTMIDCPPCLLYTSPSPRDS